METAAARAMRGELDGGQLSVGVEVRIRHLAATPIGAEV
jgi:predicted thioesterase